MADKDLPDPLVGKLIADRYRVMRLLGRGGMGAVYVATQEGLGREVALKVLRPNLADDAVAIERFKNEARVIAALHHPYIVAIHDSGATADGVLFIAMELLAGESLAARLKRVGRLPSEQAVLIVRDVTRALAAAHRRGVVHRDLKPDNIILADAVGVGEHAKVLDFGIAKLLTARTTDGSEPQQTLTGTGLVPGTPGYISPEQIAGVAQDDPRSDLYALGVTWFEMLTGKRPFSGQHAMQLFMRQLNEDVPAPSSAAPDASIPPAIDELVLWLTHKDPAQRPANAEALLERLAALAGSRGVPSTVASPALVTPLVAPTLSPADASPEAQAAPTVLQVPTMDATPMPPVAAPVGPAAAAAVTSPAAASTGSATPHTGTSNKTAAPSRAPRWRTALLAGAAALAVLGLGVRLALGGDAHELLENDLDGAFDLPVHTTEAEAVRSMYDARASFRRGDLTTAARLADSVLDKHEDEPGAWLLKSLVALHNEEWFDSLRASARAAETVRAGLGTQDRHETPAAVELIELLLRSARDKDPRVLEAWRACDSCGAFPIGDVAMARAAATHDWRTLGEALKTIDAAKAKDPGFVLAHLEESNLSLLDGQADDALRAADAGLRVAPGTPVLLLARASALIAHGELDQAERAIQSALPSNPGIGAELLLARIAVLRDDEPARQRILDNMRRLHGASPAGATRIAVDHGEALVGAGRVDDALALYDEAVRGALAAGAPEAAGYLLLRATKVIGPSVRASAPSNARLLALAGEVLQEPQLPPAARNVLAAVKSLVEGAVAVERGDLEAAHKRLDALERLPGEYVADYLRPKLLVYLTMPLAIAEGRWDDAMASTVGIDEVCVRHAAEAHVLAAHAMALHARGDAGAVELQGQAQRALDWFGDHAWACRAIGAQGAPVISMRALGAVVRHLAGDEPGARAALAELKVAFPHAHPDLRGVAEALALLGPPAK